MPFGLGTQTVKVTTGNVRTTYDPFSPAPGASTPGPTPAPFNGLAMPLGTIFTDVGGPDSVSGTSTQLPTNASTVYKYVLYKSTTNPTLVARPSVVYYTDNAATTVSGTLADGLTATAADVAGIMMVNTTDLSGLTAAILNNSGNGSGVWIAINGFVKGVNSPGSVAVGDYLIGASGNFTLARIAAAAAQTCNPLVGIALTAVSSNACDMSARISLDV